MTALQIIPTSSKKPRFVAKILHAQGKMAASAAAAYVLVLAVMGSTGTAVPETVVYDVFSEDQADLLAAPGSPAAASLRAAIKVPGTKVKFVALAEPSSGTAATMTLTLTGSWTTSGEILLTIAGWTFPISSSASDTLTTFAAAIASEVNKRPFLPVTASSALGVVTLTFKVKGTIGRGCLVHLDKSQAANGMLFALAGSATAGNDRVFMGNASTGTGTPDVTTALQTLGGARYARIAPGVNDPTNAALIEAYLLDKAEWNRDIFEHACFATVSDFSTTQSLAKTTLNVVRACVAWGRLVEVPWWEVAAETAAIRAVMEVDNPKWDSDGYVYRVARGRTAHRYTADSPSDAEQDLALDNGVCPLITVNGELRLVRGVNSYCVNPLGLADERCLDWGEGAVPDAIALAIIGRHVGFREANPDVGPNPPPELEGTTPAGTATPNLWRTELELLARAPQTGFYARGWIEKWESEALYNEEARGIESAYSFVVRRLNHKSSVLVRQASSL